mmetsp:Transcript_107635/g.131340  ORF Transcript_107635/g.131340 Transcript_107635/m.131340 type:complete len:238 (-) Transcript_107635:31-744(-)
MSSNNEAKTDASNNANKKVKSKPIVRIKEIIATENKWVKLYFDDVNFIGKNGKIVKGNYNRFAYKSKGLENVPGTIILPMNKDGKIGLITQYRYPIDKWCWEFPRGFGDGKLNDSVNNAQKELLEEMKMKGDKFIKVGSIAENTGISTAINDYFVVTNCEYVKKNDPINKKYDHDDEVEIIDNIKFVSYSELKTLIGNGEIIDAFTITCLQLATIKCPQLFKDDANAADNDDAKNDE